MRNGDGDGFTELSGTGDGTTGPWKTGSGVTTGGLLPGDLGTGYTSRGSPDGLVLTSGAGTGVGSGTGVGFVTGSGFISVSGVGDRSTGMYGDDGSFVASLVKGCTCARAERTDEWSKERRSATANKRVDLPRLSVKPSEGNAIVLEG